MVRARQWMLLDNTSKEILDKEAEEYLGSVPARLLSWCLSDSCLSTNEQAAPESASMTCAGTSAGKFIFATIYKVPQGSGQPRGSCI